jgi:glycosyltransferase involved in cell wall biosynthesis
VVSTNVGGIPSILRDGVGGLLVPDNDDQALAAATLRLLTNQRLARNLAASAHATLDAYQWPVVREAWVRAYRSVSARRGKEATACAVSPAPSNHA